MIEQEFENRIKDFWEDWLRERGWSTWYNENYWVHRDSVEDSTKQDYTNYGMGWQDAVRYERLGKPKHKYTGCPQLSQEFMALDTGGLKHEPKANGEQSKQGDG